MALTLNEFINYWAENNQISKNKAREDIDTFIRTFKNATFEKGGVNIREFLESEVVDVPAKEVINPRTKEKIKVPAKRQVKIKIKKNFKNMEDTD